jgi:hypothetical protein
LTVRREVEGAFDPGYDRFEIYIHGLETTPGQVRVDGAPVEVAFDSETGIARLTAGEWENLRIRGTPRVISYPTA